MPYPPKISDEHRVHGSLPKRLTRRGYLRIAAGLALVKRFGCRAILFTKDLVQIRG